MRRALLTLLTVAAVVTGCGEADDGGAGEAPAGEPITLSVGIDSVYAPMFLAAAEDLFADEGIRVELRQFAQGGEGVDAMLAGEIDVAASADSTFLVRAARTDIAVLGPYVEDDGDYVKLVTREEITDPAQIEKIGVIPGQISEYGAAKLLEAEGIDAESVEVVKVAGPPEMPPLLQRGDVDAFVLNEPWPTRAQELGAKVLMDASEFDLGYTLVLASTPAWAEEHRDEATALMRAMAAAAERTEQDPEAAAEATEEAAKVEPEQTVKAVEDLIFEVRDFDSQDLDRLEDVGDFLLERGIVEERPPVDEVFSPERSYVP
jgi:ABC-type nitrate/sulfonate/bicarbonate transport system substrate-binding protein